MKQYLKKFIGNKFVKGTAVFMLANVLVSFFNYLFNSLSAKALGPQGYGEIAALFAYLSVVSIPMSIATTLIVQKLGNAGEQKALYALALRDWVELRMKKWWYLFVLPLTAIPFLPRFTNLSMISAIGLSSMTSLSLFTSFYVALLQGLQLFSSFSALSVLQTFIKLLGTLFVLWGFGKLGTLILFIVFSNVVAYFFTQKRLALLARTFKDIKKISFDSRVVEILRQKQTIIAACSLIGLAVLSNADIILVKKFFPATEAGLYGIWSLFAKIILYIAGPILAVAFVFFSDNTQKHMHRKLLILLTVLFVVGSLFSYSIYRSFHVVLLNLIASSSYSAISSLLPFAAFFGSLYGLLTLYNSYFLAQKNSGSLINFLGIPLYVFLLFLARNSLESVVWVNIIYTAIIVVAMGTWILLQKKETANR